LIIKVLSPTFQDKKYQKTFLEEATPVSAGFHAGPWFLWREENCSTKGKTLGVRSESTTNSTHATHGTRLNG